MFCSTEAWKAVVDKLQDARANARMKQLSHSSVNGLTMFGLSHSAITFLTEQLFGARHCRNYNHKYHAYERDEFDEVRMYYYLLQFTHMSAISLMRCAVS